ncbi:MAG TPA: imidazolonepropionase [Acidimicrobiales bacterium]|nr:imidazolonepropionase [Acidimicrobiales bacterium]
MTPGPETSRPETSRPEMSRTPDGASTLLTGIGQLVTNDPAHGGQLGVIEGAALVVENGMVTWVGAAAHAPPADAARDLEGRAVVPGFVDSHTHLVFAGDRAAEFEARLRGEHYDGGGIASTTAATRAATDQELRDLLGRRLAEMRGQGTTTVEVKSGYGLDVAEEARLLRLARERTPETTYLGAHVVPAGAVRAEYAALVCGEMLAACAPFARWADVFCEPASPHAFDADETRAVLGAARHVGLGLRVHANQLSAGPGVQLAAELGAASADHCTHLRPADVDALAGSATVATLLPGVEWSTRAPYPDARRLLDAGATVALATDCNPGTCYTSSMPFIIALAVRELQMSPAEALWAATAGGARALQRQDIGVVAVGGRADLAVLEAPSYVHLAYRPGASLARALVL